MTWGARIVRVWLLLATASQVLATPSFGETPAEHADALAEQGLAASLRGEYDAANTLYRRAFALDPAPEHLYSIARTAHQAGHCDAAESDYLKLLEMPELPTDLRVKAQFHLAEAQQQQRTHQCEPLPPPGQPASSRPAIGWALVGVAATSALASVALLWHAQRDQDALDSFRDASGHYRAELVSPSAVTDMQGSIQEQRVLGWTALGMGAAAAGVAIWLLRTPSSTPTAWTIEPAPTRLTWRF